MSIIQLLQDYGVPHTTEGHSHNTEGWVNIHCPFCAGSQDFHLGINLNQPAVSHCWRCGGHSTAAVLARILNITSQDARRLIEKYAGPGAVQVKKVREPRVSIWPLKFPQPSMRLNTVGKNYLAGRGFDPDKLEEVWKLRQTGPVSFLDKIPYQNRIIIPIYWNGELASFQTRDITGQAERKYLACPMKRERVHHKNILYGKQKKWRQFPALIVVEGVFDVWRLGPCAAATFGTSFKMEQVLELAKAHDRFFIIYDNEHQAQEQAHKLAVKLKALGKKVTIETVPSDPGDMKQDDADHLIKLLLRGRL